MTGKVISQPLFGLASERLRIRHGESSRGVCRVVAAAALLVLAACTTDPTPEPPVMADLVIQDVSVITMASPETLAHRDVYLSGDRIAAIAPSDPDMQHSARVIDGSGKYLMPGLSDLHVHFGNKDHLLLFLANGVTTIRNMAGNPAHLRFRAAVAEGLVLGPTIITAGPHIDGNPPVWPNADIVETAEDARKVVRGHKVAGYDFLKVYQNLSPSAYRAVAEEARKLDMRFAGHTPGPVGLSGTIDAGQWSVEHLNGFWEALLGSENPRQWATQDRRARAGQLGRRLGEVATGKRSSAEAFDLETLRKHAANMRDKETWIVPTLILHQGVSSANVASFEANDRMGYIDPLTRGLWYQMFGTRPENRGERIKLLQAAMMLWTRVLHEEGVNLALGTDAMNPYVLPGFSVHEELQLLVDAGFSPYEALETGTILAAKLLGEDDEVGTVAVGKRADLLLLSANPLEDIANSAAIEAVLIRGRWLSRQDLDEALAGLASRHQQQEALVGPFLRESDATLLTTAIDQGELLPIFEPDQLGMLVQATIAMQQPQLGLAVAKQFAEANPESGEALFFLSEAHVAVGEIRRAIEIQEELIARDPSSAFMQRRLQALQQQLE